jgi:cephalosporin hydroxylase
MTGRCKCLGLKGILIFISFFTVDYSMLYSEWNPEDCFLEEGAIVSNELDNAGFKKLKVRVECTLQDSWCSKEKINLLMDLVLITKPKICVEIGAFTGSSVLPVAATLQYLQQGQIFAIDAWSNAEAIKDLEDSDPNKAWWGKVDMQYAENIFQSMLNHWKLTSYCTKIHSPSSVAVNQIPNNIDFLHLDGNFSEEGSLADLNLYLPKVKEGGYILLSNLLVVINSKQSKFKTFCAFCETCELVAEIDHDNTVLFRKM